MIDNYFEFNKKIIEFKKNNQYKELLNHFKKNKLNFPKKQIANDKYLIPNILTALRKTNNSKYIDSFLTEFNIPINNKTNQILLNLYGWSIYDNIKNRYYNKNDILTNIKNIISILQEKNDTYSNNIVSNIFRAGIQVSKESQNRDFKFIKEFCELFDVQKLSEDCEIYNIKGKDVEQDSDKEKWYSEMSKSLFELEMYNNSFKFSKDALANLNKFHFGNELWLARRLALSKKYLGNLDEAILDLEEIYLKKKDWFIKKEIAELYFESNDFEKSFENALIAINSKSKIEFKVSLIMLIGKILKLKKEFALAKMHFLLVKQIRNNNSWKESLDLENELNSLEINIDDTNLLKHLNEYWNSFSKNDKESNNRNTQQDEIFSGYIKKILNENEKGKNGFIESKKGSYYFSIPSHIKLCIKIQKDKKVKFKIENQKNGKQKAKILKVF
ncbi:hypothetical protein GCM10012288_13760 [Malaciobacter pacificus]|uniref:Uncharacterized protein n=1 Tax=Malaciobacter pacificus TaxID=1080223 RepID=A0A5C2HBF9_9BACT|nr:hypothetical protein [Malaciobacter pacificus]QEP34855.1 hypothetical protein APAC_1768 [Malaciobacter pacificus]GGD40941.1 hypothetical protein GCM10012288_13760 [Malaciobacter pacificus]